LKTALFDAFVPGICATGGDNLFFTH